MKIIKKILWVLLAAFIIIQFFRPTKNQSIEVLSSDISRNYQVPAEVQTILAKACNDCHSNNTYYPWYNNFQPVAWWLNNHVMDGKRHLNFSEFTTMRVAKQYKRMNDCIETIKKNEMPLESYTWIHKDAILNETEKQILYAWCNTVRDSIKAKYPADSLLMPKRK